MAQPLVEALRGLRRREWNGLRGEHLVEDGDPVGRQVGPRLLRRGQHHGIERAEAGVLGEVDQVVDQPHGLAEQRARGWRGQGSTGRQMLDDLERQYRGPTRALDQLDVAHPGRGVDRPTLRLQRLLEQGTDVIAHRRPLVARVVGVQQVEEGLDDARGERHRRVRRER